MDATAWAVIGVGVTLLVVNGAAFRSLRNEMRLLREHVDAQGKELRERIDAQGREISQLRERMAKLEGLLEGLREAVTGKRVEPSPFVGRETMRTIDPNPTTRSRLIVLGDELED